MSSPDSTREQTARYRVVAQYVTVTTAHGCFPGRPMVQGLTHGMILPDDVPPAQITHLLDSGMIEDLDPTAAA